MCDIHSCFPYWWFWIHICWSKLFKLADDSAAKWRPDAKILKFWSLSPHKVSFAKTNQSVPETFHEFVSHAEHCIKNE